MSEVTIHRNGAVLEITLARLDKKNALTGAMYRQLVVALDAAERDETIGAILLKGDGGVFSAGNDIVDFVTGLDSGEEMPAAAFIRKLALNTTPIVAAVEGLAVGVGCTLLLHCDLIYAAPDARFSLPFVNLALVPEAGSSLLLPQRVGMARASAWLLLGEPFGAQEALDAGLVNAVVPNQELLGVAREKAAVLAGKPRAALAESRRLLRGDPKILLERMEIELEAFAHALKSIEARAALASFLNKRK